MYIEYYLRVGCNVTIERHTNKFVFCPRKYAAIPDYEKENLRLITEEDIHIVLLINAKSYFFVSLALIYYITI